MAAKKKIYLIEVERITDAGTTTEYLGWVRKRATFTGRGQAIEFQLKRVANIVAKTIIEQGEVATARVVPGEATA